MYSLLDASDPESLLPTPACRPSGSPNRGHRRFRSDQLHGDPAGDVFDIFERTREIGSSNPSAHPALLSLEWFCGNLLLYPSWAQFWEQAQRTHSQADYFHLSDAEDHAQPRGNQRGMPSGLAGGMLGRSIRR